MKWQTKQILQADGKNFISQQLIKNSRFVFVKMKEGRKITDIATINQRSKEVQYNWKIIVLLKLSTFDNLLHQIDCIVKNQKPNP